MFNLIKADDATMNVIRSIVDDELIIDAFQCKLSAVNSINNSSHECSKIHRWAPLIFFNYTKQEPIFKYNLLTKTHNIFFVKSACASAHRRRTSDIVCYQGM